LILASKRQPESTEEQAIHTAEERMRDDDIAGTPETDGADSASGSQEGDTQESLLLAAEIAQVREQMLRVQADFDNFRKRTRQEKEELQQYATRKVFTDLLPVMDNFDRALSVLGGQEAATEIRTGMEMVQRQLLSVLENGGVKPMVVIGERFDPNMHEGVMQVPADGQDVGVVVRELQKGYWLHEKVLRPAMVAVTV
jgi:molecular chaperone GrpE